MMSELSDKITDIQKITMSANDVMVIQVDVENMSRAQAVSYMDQLKTAFQVMLLSNKIIVIPNRISISIIGQEEAEDAGY